MQVDHTINAEEVSITSRDDIKQELESIINESEEKLRLSEIDVNSLVKFYNLFGPEQRNKVVNSIYEFLDTQNEICYYTKSGWGRFLYVTKDRQNDDLETHLKKEIDEGLNMLDLSVRIGTVVFDPSAHKDVDSLLNQLYNAKQEAKDKVKHPDMVCIYKL